MRNGKTPCELDVLADSSAQDATNEGMNAHCSYISSVAALGDRPHLDDIATAMRVWRSFGFTSEECIRGVAQMIVRGWVSYRPTKAIAQVAADVYGYGVV